MPESTSEPGELGKIDRNILRLLQKDGRISYTDLAREVGLSVTPCIERVKRLERTGFILGYSARVSPERLGASLVVFVQIRLNHTSQKNFEEFRSSVLELENIQSCFLVSGNYDYLLKARVKDMAAYRELLGHRILKLPAVQESTSYVVMEELKETMAVPVPYSK